MKFNMGAIFIEQRKREGKGFLIIVQLWTQQKGILFKKKVSHLVTYESGPKSGQFLFGREKPKFLKEKRFT